MERYYLAFETAAPIVDEHGAARAILERIRNALLAQGTSLLEDVTPWEGYGWSIAIQAGERPMWCMIQRSDEWLLVCWVDAGLMDRLRGRENPDAGRLRREIADAVAALANHPGLQWKTETEFRRH